MESPFYIGEWLIEPAINRVAGPGGTETLEPRTMKVLVQLASAKPQVLTREELLDRVWESSVVTEHSLTIAISDLRKLFGDDPKTPGYIETIRGVGYRIVAPVRASTPTVQVTPALSILQQGDGLSVPDPAIHERAGMFTSGMFKYSLYAGLAGLLLVAVFFWWGWEKPRAEAFEIHNIQPLTTMPGAEVSPAFSPDGQRVAFVAFPDSGDISEIFVQQLGAGAPVKLTDEPGAELMPAWSPDGQYIVYLKYSTSGCALHKKPSFGGSALKLTDINCRLGGITWAPDGQSLILSAPDEQHNIQRLFNLDLQTLLRTPLTIPPPSINGDFSPGFSPDGSTLAFLRTIDTSTKDIYLLKWNPGPAENGATENGPTDNGSKLTSDGANITGFDWTADGKAIVFGSGRNNSKGLWHVQVDGSAGPRLIRAVSVDDPGSVILARTGSRLVYTSWTYEVNTWRRPVDRSQIETPQPVLTSTRSDFHPDVSANQQVTFISTRSGESEVWRSELDGRNPVQLTHLNSAGTRFPSWSPDGKQIVFVSRNNGQSDIFMIDAGGGLPQRLTEGTSQESRPTWSKDGSSVYFGSNRSGSWQVWRKALESGAVTQVTSGGGVAGWEDGDGQMLYYLRSDTTGIWRKHLDTGKEEYFLDADPSFLSISGNNLYYIKQPVGQLSLKVMRFDFKNELSTEINEIQVKPLHFFTRWGFVVSPDEQWIFFSQVDKSESDLMLAQGVL